LDLRGVVDTAFYQALNVIRSASDLGETTPPEVIDLTAVEIKIRRKMRRRPRNGGDAA